MNDEKAETIIEALSEIWFSKFGTPIRILHDLGGNFTNDSWETMCEEMGLRDTTTAANSPFSSGVVERPNAVIQKHNDKAKRRHRSRISESK